MKNSMLKMNNLNIDKGILQGDSVSPHFFFISHISVELKIQPMNINLRLEKYSIYSICTI